jgi:hypothetical protein
MGYSVALWRDAGDGQVECDYLRVGATEYQGYAKAVNWLIADVKTFDPDARWFVTGGDDTDPDPVNRADEIAKECELKFGGSFGVMQPTGDRYAGGSIDRIAGSPWIGREFVERAYGGGGPYWPEYQHMFVDEEIREVARVLGVYWANPSVTHLHRHFMRESLAIDSPAVTKPVPEFLREANSPGHWQKYQQIYRMRKAQGFPGHGI